MNNLDIIEKLQQIHDGMLVDDDHQEALLTAIKILSDLPQPDDTILRQMRRLIIDFGDAGEFVLLGHRVPSKELLIHLEANDDIGLEFRREVTEMMITFFMKFGDEKDGKS